MKSWTWSNDQFVEEHSVPVSDRGFRYGMSVFESICVRNGVPLFFREHVERLLAACLTCGFAVDFTAIERARELLGTDGFARIYLTAGDGATTSDAEACRIYVMHEERTPIATRTYHRGYDLGIETVPHAPLFGGLKTGNYWANLIAFNNGCVRQKNECLLFSVDGVLISACMANVFLMNENRLRTPARSTGARGGVVREWVIAATGAEETNLTRDDLLSCEEIFLTSSWLGIMPAASIEGRELRSRETSSRLRAEYSRLSN